MKRLKLYMLYWFFKFFKKLNEIKYFIIYKEDSILNLKVYGILGSDEKILITKDFFDYEKVKIAKYFKYKNYYII